MRWWCAGGALVEYLQLVPVQICWFVSYTCSKCGTLCLSLWCTLRWLCQGRFPAAPYAAYGEKEELEACSDFQWVQYPSHTGVSQNSTKNHNCCGPNVSNYCPSKYPGCASIGCCPPWCCTENFPVCGSGGKCLQGSSQCGTCNPSPCTFRGCSTCDTCCQNHGIACGSGPPATLALASLARTSQYPTPIAAMMLLTKKCSLLSSDPFKNPSSIPWPRAA